MTSISEKQRKVNREKGDALLVHLHRGGRWAYRWTFHNQQSLWYEVGSPPRTIPQNLDIYFGVHPTAEKSAKGSNGRSKNDTVAVVNCLFGDFDDKDFCQDCGSRTKVRKIDGENVRVCLGCGIKGTKPNREARLRHVNALEPAPTVRTESGGGEYGYWLLDAPYRLDSADKRSEAVRVQAGWVSLMGSDDGAKDIARILRIPGSFNHKPEYGEPRPVYFTKFDEKLLYSFTELAALVPDIADIEKAVGSQPSKDGTQPGNRPGDLYNADEDIKWHDLLQDWSWEFQGADGVWNLRRPGKDKGTGATLGFGDSDLLYVFTSSTAFEAGTWYSKFGAYAVLEHDGDFTAAAKALVKAGYRMDDEPDTEKKAKGPTQAQILMRLASDAELFKTDDGDLYARYWVDGHRETWALQEHGSGFRRWLTHRYVAEAGQPPSTTAMATVMAALQAQADIEGEIREVYTRIGRADGAIYIDIGDAEWRAIKITAAGWQSVANPGVCFRRTRGMLPLPVPERGGTLDELSEFLNVEIGSDEWLLLIGWLLGTIEPQGPYAHLALYGEQGTAKSTAARVLRMLVDPNKADTRAAPREERDLAIAAKNGWIVSFDNLSVLHPWLSDALCRLSTGAANSYRRLYSNEDETLFFAKRPAILNGITEVATRGDLLDRMIVVTLNPIPKEDRKRERQFWNDFDATHPRLLGALLDVVATGMANMKTIHFDELPRMADFTLWVEACAPELNWNRGEFMKAFDTSQRDAVKTQMEASPIAYRFLDYCIKEKNFTAGAGDILAALDATFKEQERKPKGWPKSAKALTAALRRLAPALRSEGWDARRNARHKWEIREITPDSPTEFEQTELS